MKLFKTIVLTSVTVCSLLIFTGCQESKAKQPNPQPITDPAPVAARLKPVIVIPTPKPAPAAKVQTEPAPKKQATKGGIPRIVFEKTVYDLGKMVPDKFYNLKFAFANKGTGNLVIERTHATCGCTVPKLEKKIYEPGESGIIKVRYHAQKTAGKVNKPLEVYSNDPAKPMVKCLIKGIVELAATVEPKMMKLSLKAENAGAQPIIIKSTTGKPISITQIKDRAGTMSFTFDPTEEATEFKFTPTVDMEKLKRKPNGSIMITVKTPEANQFSLMYRTPPLFEVSRPNLIVQNVVPGKSQEKDVWITSNYDDALEIESITSQKNYLEVISQEKFGNRIKLTIKITPPKPEGKRRNFTDKIDIKILNSDTLSVRCSGWYARK